MLGPNAVHPVIQGGGSAAVMPGGLSTPADALREALAGQAEVTVAAGLPDLGDGPGTAVADPAGPGLG